jgi:hypothetical protein
LPDRLSGPVGRLSRGFSGGILHLLGSFSRSALRLLHRFLGLVCSLSRGLLGLLGGPVHRVFHALLLGNLVEGVLYGLVGLDHLFEAGAGVLLGFGELVE